LLSVRSVQNWKNLLLETFAAGNICCWKTLQLEHFAAVSKFGAA